MAQFNKNTQQFLGDSKSLFDTIMLATADGNIATMENPIPVSLGSESITITGNVNVGTSVEVTSTAESPVHTHVTEVGTSGILSTPYLPVAILNSAGNNNDSTHPLYVSVSNLPATQPVSGSVNIGTMPSVTISSMPEVEIKNDSGNPVPVNGTVNIGTMPSVTIASIPEVEIKNDSGNPVPVNGTVNIGTMPEVEIKNDSGNPIPSSLYMGGNPISTSNLLPVTSDLSYPFTFAVSAGLVPGHSIVFISGKAAAVNATGTNKAPMTVWNGTNSYPWSVWDSGAATLYINSSSAADTQTVLISGLDSNYNLQTAVVVLNGTSFVNTGATQFLRMNSALIISDDIQNVGTINIRYGSTSGTIIGVMDPTMGSTSMSIYTVPAGHTAMSVFGDFSVNKGNQGELAAKWRFFGGPFVTVYRIELFQQSYAANVPYPGAIPEKTDIDNMVQAVDNNGSRVYSNQQFVLVDNAYLKMHHGYTA